MSEETKDILKQYGVKEKDFILYCKKNELKQSKKNAILFIMKKI